MAKRFNVTGTCFPHRHYMADISAKLKIAMGMINYGDYFAINRPRQYGKTTTLQTITNYYKKSNSYLVFRISFEGTGDNMFKEEKAFSQGFLRVLSNYADYALPKLTKWLKETSTQVEDLDSLSKSLVRKLFLP